MIIFKLLTCMVLLIFEVIAVVISYPIALVKALGYFISEAEADLSAFKEWALDWKFTNPLTTPMTTQEKINLLFTFAFLLISLAMVTNACFR